VATARCSLARTFELSGDSPKIEKKELSREIALMLGFAHSQVASCAYCLLTASLPIACLLLTACLLLLMKDSVWGL